MLFFQLYIVYVTRYLFWVLKSKAENMPIFLHKKKIINFKNKASFMNIF